MKPISIHPVSALIGAGTLVLLAVTLGAQATQAIPMLRAQLVKIVDPISVDPISVGPIIIGSPARLVGESGADMGWADIDTTAA